MEGKTYLEILAENDEEARQEFDPNAKDRLAEQNEYEDNVEPEDKHPDELENQEDFQKPHGSRFESGRGAEFKEYSDNTTASVRYKVKDVNTLVFNIDSKFRQDFYSSSTTEYTYKFLKPIRNVKSMRISGIEFPNVSYVFNTQKDNLSFLVRTANSTTDVTVAIEGGNYEDPYTFIAAIQTALTAAFPGQAFVVNLSGVTAKITISNNSNFTINFSNVYDKLRNYDNGIGYNMGFRELIYSGASSYTGESIVDTIESNYVFMSIGKDYDILTQNVETSNITAFAKILVTQPKNAVVYDTGANTITKEYVFRQPTDLFSLNVRLFDSYNYTIDLHDMNWSFTLEVDEVVGHGLYKALVSM
jgi:hypothetical protein